MNYIYQEMSENTAYIYLKMRDGKFELNGGVGHGTGLLVEAANANQPNSPTDIVIKNIGWWLGTNGKSYKTYANGPSWTFMVTANAGSQDWNSVKNQFVDPNVINPCSGVGENCGYGKYQIIAAPR